MERGTVRVEGWRVVADTALEGAARAEAGVGDQEEAARVRAGSDLEDREAGLAMAAEDWAPRRAEAAGGRGSSAQTHRRE